VATYRFVAYDIQKSLKKTFDDADITLPQIVYWIQVVANRIRFQSQIISESDMFTSIFSAVPVLSDSQGKYIDLPKQIMNLPNNGGIVYVSYNEDTCCCNGPVFSQVVFNTVNISAIHTIYGDEYTKPTPSNPYYYRVGGMVNNLQVNRLYLLGFECIEVKDVNVALLTTLDPSTVCDLDDEIPIPDERVHELMMEVLSIGKFITMVPQEVVNQGADESEPITTRVPQPQNDNQE
jgi:hypothetical protein